MVSCDLSSRQSRVTIEASDSATNSDTVRKTPTIAWAISGLEKVNLEPI